MQTPSTQALADSIISQLAASISQTVPLLPKSFTVVLAKVLAAVVVLLYKYAGATLLNMFVATASDQETTINGKKVVPLIELGRQFGMGDPVAATFAELVVTVPVQVQSGSLAAGAQLLHRPTGIIYVTKAARALDASSVTVTVRAAAGPPDASGNITDGSGVVGNRLVADQLEFANPLGNVSRIVSVQSVAVTAADAETMPEYRARLTRYCQARPQGGAYADYPVWGGAVAGIVNIYPYTSATPGEVDVYVEADEESSGSADGIPTGPQLAAVVAAIEADVDGLASNRPANAGVNVYAITRKAFSVTVVGLTADDESAAEDLIEEAVDEWLRTREPFIVGLSVLPRTDRITLAALGGIVHDAVSSVGGTVSNVADFLVAGVPGETAYTLGPGEKAKRGTVTFA
jgi:uncharacterized phage protein gp47/JayE